MKRMCMKIVGPIFAALIFICTMGGNSAAFEADGVISEQELTPDSYCHLKFPAIREETLAGDHQVLKVPNDGNLIDFYGPCDEDPVGKDQVYEQRIENQHQREFD
jgi:hypothetical protein